MSGNDPTERGFGLYVHWPFCKSKCPYCDFNSHVRESIDEAAWANAYLAEMRHFAEMTPGRVLTSLYFGGGTPSLMQGETVARLIAEASRLWSFAPEIEITLEANPNSVEAGRFRDFRAAGINRVSLGIQALDDASLKFLGRQHNAGEALAALEIARNNFERFSFDLIYARPGQSPKEWKAELTCALSYAGDHLSLYQLTIEQGTQFEQAYARGDFRLPDEETQAELYELTNAAMERAGFAAYEISNYARPGNAHPGGVSRHNLTYWRYGDYVGIGPGAHGRLTLDGEKIATRQHRAPEKWLELVAAHGHATRQRQIVSRAERLAETAMMGLRLAEGVPLRRFEEEGGKPFVECFDQQRLARLVAGGFLALSPARLAATGAGRQRLNAVLKGLLA